MCVWVMSNVSVKGSDVIFLPVESRMVLLFVQLSADVMFMYEPCRDDKVPRSMKFCACVCVIHIHTIYTDVAIQFFDRETNRSAPLMIRVMVIQTAAIVRRPRYLCCPHRQDLVELYTYRQ